MASEWKHRLFLHVPEYNFWRQENPILEGMNKNKKEQVNPTPNKGSLEEDKDNLFGFFDLLLRIEKRNKRQRTCTSVKLKSSPSSRSKGS